MTTQGGPPGSRAADAGETRRRLRRGRRPGGDGQPAVPHPADRRPDRLRHRHIADRLDRAADRLERATGGSGSGEASQQGALAEVAAQPFGAVLLWVIVIGLFAMTIWQIVEAIWGHRDRPAGWKRIRKRLGSAGRAVAYAAIGIAAVRTVLGSSGSGNNKEEGWTARLMSVPFGRILVIAVAVAIIVLGVRLVRRGVKKKFTEDLAGGVGPGVVRLGQAGYIARASRSSSSAGCSAGRRSPTTPRRPAGWTTRCAPSTRRRSARCC